MSNPLKRVAVPAAVAGLLVASVESTAAGIGDRVVAPAPRSDEAAASAATVTATTRHEHSIRTSRARGKFTCGDLRLRITEGRETEEKDGDLRNGVAHLFVSRVWRHVVLAGSDGRTYRASSVVAAWDVLHAPDFERPVSGLEVVQVMFRGGPDKSPGWLREQIRFVHGHETDAVTGPCDFVG